MIGLCRLYSICAGIMIFPNQVPFLGEALLSCFVFVVVVGGSWRVLNVK